MEAFSPLGGDLYPLTLKFPCLTLSPMRLGTYLICPVHLGVPR